MRKSFLVCYDICNDKRLVRVFKVTRGYGDHLQYSLRCWDFIISPAALALDLIEPFRPLIVDSAVMTAINTKMVSGRDFLVAGGGVALTKEGRKAFYRAYELRMDMLVTHPIFGYRVSYRRLLEVQVRLLAKLLDGDIPKYPVFVTR
jgi:CRISPR/Cas system-associated endonuclease Cas1